MAAVYVTTGQVGVKVNGDICLILQAGSALGSEVITSSATSAAGARVAGVQTIAKISCATAVYAKSGPAGTVATPATSLYIPGGLPDYIGQNPGDIIAVIDA